MSLIELIRAGDTEAVAALCRDSPSLALERVSSGSTLAHVCALQGSLPMLMVRLQHCPLHSLIRQSVVDAAKHSDVDLLRAFNRERDSVLHFAAVSGSLALVDWLMDRG
jgi:hypothetical protein